MCSLANLSAVDNADNLLDRCFAHQRFAQRVVLQRSHARCQRRFSYAVRCRVLQYLVPNLVVDRHQFVQSRTALVSRPLAEVASRAAIELDSFGRIGQVETLSEQFMVGDCVLFLASRADRSGQSLRQYGDQRRSDHEGFDAHFGQARRRAGGVVRMQGRQD